MALAAKASASERQRRRPACVAPRSERPNTPSHGSGSALYGRTRRGSAAHSQRALTPRWRGSRPHSRPRRSPL